MISGSTSRVCAAFVLLLLVSACEPEPARGPRPLLDRIESDLLARKYFIPAELEVTGVVFYCVCGPYMDCERESKELADKLGYERPPYKFRPLRERQKVMFFRTGDIVDVEFPFTRLLIAGEHEASCSTNMDLKIPQYWKLLVGPPKP